jgi:AcrR family transcriptional regulator
MEDTRQRIIEATYACVARWGVAKTTVEDAAREAAVSRATVYRHFPGGRDELIHDVVVWELFAFFGRLYDEVQGAESLEAVMERGICFAHRSIQEHEVLQRVMQTEPETLLPTITVESNRIRAAIAGFLVPYLHQHGLAPGVDNETIIDLLFQTWRHRGYGFGSCRGVFGPMPPCHRMRRHLPACPIRSLPTGSASSTRPWIA